MAQARTDLLPPGLVQPPPLFPARLDLRARGARLSERCAPMEAKNVGSRTWAHSGGRAWRVTD